MLFHYITWTAEPVAFELFGWPVRWYGIFYAVSFLVGHYLLGRIFKLEQKPEKDLDALTIATILGVVVGARLGHVFFYSWDYYQDNLAEIFMVWKGGLASHGAAIGVAVAIWLYQRPRPNQSFLWVADRLLVAVSFGSSMIRLGNLMNSEIVGKKTTVPWAFIFENHRDPALAVDPRHPTQLYEAGAYMILFFVMIWLYWRKKERNPNGFLAGFFLAALFTLRFVIEFFKIPQEDYDNPLPINTGQILSIPLVVLGLYLIYRAITREKAQKAATESEE